ncbi:ubx domain-containing protein 4 [Limosa lapponica baueri]|uniref:Ubx domain-containing protein 4 n=1 Tax=Limosa lapponica baueri TaxID=1758121 RepID=A0A2I0U5W2_LIMLA|nr:ubx domain-containing protein 4 [Limosa lapponica baueri]
MPEAALISNRASASQLQDGLTTGQSRANEQQWCCLCDNIFQKGKNLLCNSSQKRGVRICKKNNSSDIKVSEGGGAPDVGAEIPLRPVVKIVLRQAVLLQPMEVNGGADIHLQPVGFPCWSKGMHPKETVTPWEACAGAGSWQDLWTHGERTPRWSRFAGRTCDPHRGCMLEQSIPEGLHLMERTHGGAVHEELQPIGRTHTGVVRGELSPRGGTPHWSRGGV